VSSFIDVIYTAWAAYCFNW